MSLFDQLVNVRAGELEQSILHRPVSHKKESERKQERKTFFSSFFRTSRHSAA